MVELEMMFKSWRNSRAYLVNPAMTQGELIWAITSMSIACREEIADLKTRLSTPL